MKKIFYLLSITFLLLQSCSSGDSPDSPGSPDNPNPSGGTLLKKIVCSNGLVFNYTYNGNKLSKIAGENGENSGYYKFTYTGDLITKYEIANNYDEKAMFKVFNYENNDIKQIKNYSWTGVLEDVDDLIYNNDGTITVTKTDSGSGIKDIHIYKEYYNSEGNIYKTTNNYGGGETSVDTYEYDTKNSPFKNIIGMTNLSRFNNTMSDLPYTTFIFPVRGSLNNVIKVNSDDNITASYQFNNQGFPISATINENGQIYILTYYYY